MPSNSKHPSDETLASYNLGSMDSILLGAIAAHLADCEECRRRSVRLSTIGGVGAPPPPSGSPVPPELAAHPDYKIVRELGRGGMGVVYLAENLLMGRKEVLKVVSAHLVKQKTVMDRFLQEVRAAAQLHHPNIVAAFNASRLGEGLVFSMEYVEGYDLSRLVEAKGKLDVPIACTFIHQAAQGLQHAHERGMVHRDVKPSNLMVAREGRRPIIKILDFGLAKLTREAGVDAGLTQQGAMMGTPEYVAPEQTRDAQKVDVRADVYSLGCTLYCLLAGRPPFSGSLYEILSAHNSVEATPLNQIRPDVPAALAELVAKMMAKNPADRFQTPGEVASALAPIIRQIASKSSEKSAASQTRAESGTMMEAPPFASPPSSNGATLVERPGGLPGSPRRDRTLLEQPDGVRPAPRGGRTLLERPADSPHGPLDGRTVLESAPFAPRDPLSPLTVLETPGFQDKPQENELETASGVGKRGILGAVAAAALLAVLVPLGLYLGRPGSPSRAPETVNRPKDPIAPSAPQSVRPLVTEAKPREAEPTPAVVPALKPESEDEPRIVDAKQDAAAALALRTAAPTPNIEPSSPDVSRANRDPFADDGTNSTATPTTSPTASVDLVDAAKPAPVDAPEPTPEIKGAVTLSRLQEEMSDFDGREVEIADLLKIGRSPFDRSPKFPGGIGCRIDTREGYDVSLGRGMFDYRRKGGKSEVQLLIDPTMAANYEQKLKQFKIGGDGKPEIPTVVRLRVHAPKGGGNAHLTMVAMEVLLGYDKVRLASGELDRNFVAIEAFSDEVYSGYVDGAKWVERLGGEKFISSIRSKVKKARSNAAADRRAAEFDVFFNQVAAVSAQIARQNQAANDAQIRRLRTGQ